MTETSDYVFILGSLFLIIIYIIRCFIYLSSKEEKEILDYNEMEKMFFDKVSESCKPYKLLNIYTPMDLMMIQSFFISENIPYNVQFEHFMKVYPFVHSLNYNNTSLYILEEDYNDAILVINNYIENKNLDEYKVKLVLLNVFEYINIGWTAPSPQYNPGIEVNYR